jgi:glycosyltransferase involved in cell wall biosynthesis
MVSRPINVLHIVSNLAGGGVQRLLVKSLAVLDRTDFTHQVCCVSSGGVYEDELRALDIPYRIMKRRARFDPTVVLQMARWMQRGSIDVVHTMNFTANAWGRLAAWLARVPRIIAHERGTAWTESATMRLVDRILYRVTDLWLANSEAARTILTQHVGLPKARIRVVHNGMPSPERLDGNSPSLHDRLGLAPDVPIVGAMGRLDILKGHIYLLRAVPRLLEAVPEAHVVLVGDGPLRASLEAEAAQLDLITGGHVHFTGFSTKAPEWMYEMAVLVQPSIREPLGNALIEAAWAGLPVVASNVDGCPEVVVDGETGVLVDCTMPAEYVRAPGASPLPAVVVDGCTRMLRPPLGPNPEALANAIVKLLLDPQLRRQMGERARERAQQLFSLERYVQQLQSAYRGDLCRELC